MFWKFNLLTSHIDTLLEKEDVTLQEVLDEDDVLQECKGQNPKLIEFLMRPEHLEELVNLVTQEPTEDTDEKVKYKYPNTACELLTSDIQQINDRLVGEELLLNKIYSFMEAEGPLNPLLASFFSKVMGLLITRKSEKMLEFLKAKDDFVGQLLHHLGTSAIMDLLLRLITCIESPEHRRQAIEWLHEQDLVSKLIGMIDPSQDEEKHCNASQTLCDIIRLSREQMSQLQEKAEEDPLLALIESEETVSNLLSHMLDGQRCESVLISGLSVIQTLLEFKKTGAGMFCYSPEGSSEQMTQLDAERLAQGVTNTLRALCSRFKDLHQVLEDPPRQYFSSMPTTVGTLMPPLGNTRLQIARLLATVLQTNTHSLNEELERLRTIDVLLDLQTKYIWNNFLHTQVEQCIVTILNSCPAEGEENQESPLLSQLFRGCRLIQRILDAWEDNDNQQTRPGGRRRGYMGHVTKIANHVTDSLEKGANMDRIKELIKEVPEDYKERWDTFLNETLAEMNKKNRVELVGSHPLHSSSEDEDPDFRDIPFPQDSAMQQAFSDYQLQQMTSTFIDQFGFNEEEFAEQEDTANGRFPDRISSINFDINTADDNPNAASLFEQACNERMSHFDDDVANEEALWETKEITFSQGTRTKQSSLQNSNRSTQDTGDDSDGSTDSEEELDSPTRIYQSVPGAKTEKMEVDPTDAAEPTLTPVAMDTQSPWEQERGNQTSAETNKPPETWANFDSIAEDKTEKETKDEWADFSQFNSLGSSKLNTDPGPRSSSPVAMDTGDAAPSNSRTAAYLVSSAPADLATEVASSTSPASECAKPDPASPQQSIQDASQASVQSQEKPESTETKPSVEKSEAAPEEEKAPVGSSSSAGEDQDTAEAPPTPRGAPPSPKELLKLNESPNKESQGKDKSMTESSQVEGACGTDDIQVQTPFGTEDDFDDEYDDDLMDNFSFLASAGLMKVDHSEENSQEVSPVGTTQEAENPSSQENQETDNDSIENARAKAKEALEMFTASTTSGTPQVQNGPI